MKVEICLRRQERQMAAIVMVDLVLEEQSVAVMLSAAGVFLHSKWFDQKKK